MSLSIGIDFGGTSIKAGVVRGGEIIDSPAPLPTGEDASPGTVLPRLADLIAGLREKHPAIVAVGIGVPGFVDFPAGAVHNLTNVPGWKNFPLRRELSRLASLPVAVENDANAMAVAEWKQGAGQGMSDLVALTLGTGVGGGIVANGRLLRGHRSGAAEIGQTSIHYRGKAGAYGNKGALEDYIGNREIEAEAARAYEKKNRSLPGYTPKDLAAAARGGDPLALSLWDGIAEKLSCALMNCCYLLNPEALILGGGIARAGSLLFRPLEKHLFPQLPEALAPHLRILPARFGNEAGLIGAAALALEEAS